MKLRGCALVLLAAIAISLLGCSQTEDGYERNSVFKGESGNWSADLSVKKVGTGNKKLDTMIYKTFILKYKGKNANELGVVSYSYKTASSFTTANEENQNGVFTHQSSTTAPLSNDEIIEVTVKWNDSEEAFQMKIDS